MYSTVLKNMTNRNKEKFDVLFSDDIKHIHDKKKQNESVPKYFLFSPTKDCTYE